MTQSTAAYVIPDAEATARKFAWVGYVIFALVVLVISARGYFQAGAEGIADVLFSAIMIAVFVLIVLSLPLATYLHLRRKGIWATHTYEWYRSAFPEHAHAKGRVSCRHCGGEHVRTERLMNQTYMRVHTCGQCGQTLYFSPEKR